MRKLSGAVVALVFLLGACSPAPAAPSPAAAPTSAPAAAAPTTAPAAAPTTAPAAAPTTAEAAPTTAPAAAETPAASGAAPSGEPILIGFSAPLTGDIAANGEDGLSGARLAVKQINAKGGVLGRPLQLVEADDRCDPKESATVATKLVSQKVVAIDGYYCSGAALAGLPIFQEAGDLFIDFGANNSKLPGQGYDKFFSVIYMGGSPGTVAARYAVQKMNIKKIAVVDDRTPALGEFAAAFEAEAKKQGAEVLLHDYITQGDKDFSTLITKIKGSGAELVFGGLYYDEGALFVKQMKDQDAKFIFFGSDAVQDPQFLKIAGDTAEGIYMVAAPQPNELDSAKQFLQDFKAEYNKDPGYISRFAYDGMFTIAAAYTAVGKVDNDAAGKWLHGLTKDTAIKGVGGPIFFLPDGTIPPEYLAFGIYQVKGGEYKLIAQT